MMKFSLAQESRRGGRPYNQDRIGAWRTAEALLMAVADGMGGHAGGELAAQAAVDCLVRDFAEAAKPSFADPAAFVSRAMARAHAAIVGRGAKAGLTTLVACVVQAGYAYWSFVGDSRLYLIREGRVLARTKDHSVVQQLVDAGRIREEAVGAHPERNKLLRCLGGGLAPRFEQTECARLAKGDLVLLCTDGLWGPLTPRRLVAGFIGAEPGRALAETVALAQAHGGSGCDNISGVAMRWEEEAVLDLAVY